MAKIGVYVCLCDGDIAEAMDTDALVKHAQDLPDVERVEPIDHLCSAEGLGVMVEDVKNETVDRVVVAGCTPITHEGFIGDALEEAGLNRYLITYANIREQCAWVHPDKAVATEKGKSLISMAVTQARFAEPLERPEVEIEPAVLVIGGGMAGMRAALDVAESGFKAYLVEKEEELGGRAYKLQTTYPTSNCGICCMHNCKDCRLTPKREMMQVNKNIEVFTSSEVVAIDGHVGNYSVQIQGKEDEVQTVTVGAVIIATGSKTFDPHKIPEYGYKNQDVVTFLELEGLDQFKRPSDGKVPKVVNIILCVGSRSINGGNPWCSLVCCNYALGQAATIKRLYPDTQVYVHYMDLRAAYRGFEEFYAEARELGVTFVRGRVAQVEKVGDKLLVKAKDIDSGKMLKIRSDMVVLAVGQEPADGSDNIACMTYQKVGEDGFIKDVNLQFRSMEETGVFVAGCAQGPKGIRYSVGDAKIASANVISLIKQGKISLTPVKARVAEDICSGCGKCEESCPYGAVKVIERLVRASELGTYNDALVALAEVDTALCQGCGNCSGACPSGAIEQDGYTSDQIMAMIQSGLTSGGD